MKFQQSATRINERLIIHLPSAISQQLNSRGIIMAAVTIDDSTEFIAALEPDGRGSHKWQWLRATKSDTTRQKRIDKACQQLHDNHKRPCCFDASRCTAMDVAKNGVLIGLNDLK